MGHGNRSQCLHFCFILTFWRSWEKEISLKVFRFSKVPAGETLHLEEEENCLKSHTPAFLLKILKSSKKNIFSEDFSIPKKHQNCQFEDHVSLPKHKFFSNQIPFENLKIFKEIYFSRKIIKQSNGKIVSRVICFRVQKRTVLQLFLKIQRFVDKIFYPRIFKFSKFNQKCKFRDWFLLFKNAMLFRPGCFWNLWIFKKICFLQRFSKFQNKGRNVSFVTGLHASKRPVSPTVF